VLPLTASEIHRVGEDVGTQRFPALVRQLEVERQRPGRARAAQLQAEIVARLARQGRPVGVEELGLEGDLESYRHARIPPAAANGSAHSSGASTDTRARAA